MSRGCCELRTGVRRRFANALASALFGLLGCGAGEAPRVEPPVPAASGGGEALAAPRAGMQVEGLMGTIPQRRIEETLQAKQAAFQRCFFEGMSEVEVLGGHIKFYFRVGLDGRVEWVQPRGSSIGHRPTELCLLELASKVRFPEPKGGGPAEFVWGFEIENPGGVRPPVAWPEARVTKPVETQRSALAACGVGAEHYTITAYVAPGGKVLAAGVATDAQPEPARLDCIVSAIKTWHMPDPGSYPAKVSFGL
jgi:hypothetical protein